ncbi:unnamed protein product [Peniophora sp. CBMAI 1063]|nr:unnamed protein product [Peniophora sp. CBMAI 1063]
MNLSLFSLASFVHAVLAGTFGISDSYEGEDFINDWNCMAIDDPNHGTVNYVSQSTAISQGLVFSSGSNFTLRADDTNVVSTSSSGRSSVRIQSPHAYNSHVTVINLEHMPKGCGTWPAIWEVGPSWPFDGEVDIVEGSNDIVKPNQATLHTGPGCTIPTSGDFSGSVITTDCDSSNDVNNNIGCAIKFSAPNSYGHDFNLNQGGFFASERSTTEVKVWFWARNANNIPSDVLQGSNTIDTDNWGKPQAFFPDTQCDIGSHFSNNNIIINLNFCGDLAANTYAASGCPGTCDNFVRNNPAAMNNAYFNIMWLKVYE